MTLPDDPAPDQPAPQRPQSRRGRLVALAALPIICCAGSALLAAAGIGSLGALLAATTGRGVLAVVLALLGAGVLALSVLRRRGSPHDGAPAEQAAQHRPEGQ